MPLRSGSSQESISFNIAELMHSYERTGKIGNTKPKNKKHAQRIAARIAYEKAREHDK